MTIEKKPHDWNAEEKLTMLLSCASLSEEQISERCRMNGLFPHHLEQWRTDFITQQTTPTIGRFQESCRLKLRDCKKFCVTAILVK
jgi:hypothetical protein